MSPTMLLILAGALALGFLLAVLGWRGKRINDHPICRGCGFDLSGVLPGGVTCPECGAGLKREKAIRNGARRRRWVVVAIGAVMIVLPLLSGGMIGYAAITGTDLNRYKPVRLLRWETQNTGPDGADAAAAELARRYQDGELDADAKASLVEFILAVQPDRSSYWSDSFGSVIDLARTTGDVSEETFQRFLETAAVLDYKVRRQIGIGELIPVVADLAESRLGGAGMTMGHYWVRSATIGGEPARVQGGMVFGPDGPEPHMLERNAQVGWVYLFGAGGGWGGQQQDGSCGISFLVEQPEGLGAGVHTLELELLAKVVEQSGAMAMTWNPPKGENPKGFKRSMVTLDFRLVEEDPIERGASSPDMDERLANSISISGTSASRSFLSTHAWIHLTFTKPPADFAFDAKLRQGEREWPLGHLTSGRLASQMNSWGQTDAAYLQGETKGLGAEPVDLVLTPNASVARQTIDMTRMYDGEIVIEGIDIQTQSSGFGTFLRNVFGG